MRAWTATVALVGLLIWGHASTATAQDLLGLAHFGAGANCQYTSNKGVIQVDVAEITNTDASEGLEVVCPIPFEQYMVDVSAATSSPVVQVIERIEVEAYVHDNNNNLTGFNTVNCALLLCFTDNPSCAVASSDTTNTTGTTPGDVEVLEMEGTPDIFNNGYVTMRCEIASVDSPGESRLDSYRVLYYDDP